MNARSKAQSDACRIYVFLGEAALTEAPSKALIEQLVSRDALDLDLEHVRLPENSVSQVRAALAQVGMFARGRCVLLTGALERSEDIDEILSLLETGIPPDAALVIVVPKLDGRSRLFRWLQKHAHIEDLRLDTNKDGSLSDVGDLVALVRARIVRNGFPEPSATVLDAIVARASTNVAALAGEVDRLCLSIDPVRELTLRDVETEIRDLTSVWIFDFVNALLERRPAVAHKLITRLLKDGEAPLRMVALLSTKTADFLAAARVAESQRLPPPPANAGAFANGIYPRLSDATRRRFHNPYAAYHVFRVAQTRGSASLRGLHRQLLKLDLALKSGGGQPRHLLAEFIDSAAFPYQRSR